MTKQERRAGIFLVLLGVAVMYYAVVNLSLGSLTQPGPGLFPFISGAGITILSTVWILINLKFEIKSEPLWEKGELLLPLIAALIIILYAALMDTLGYILSTVAFLVAWQYFIEREKWVKTALITIIGTVVMYLLFANLLSVPLPEGIFSI
jgi:putative tricarboxylic transport membrane protein